MKKILALVLAVVMIFTTVVSVSAFADIDPENKYKYEDIILPEFFDEDELEEEPLIEIYYSEKYEYYSDNNATEDEAIPDYVLIYLRTNMCTAMPIAYAYGDYVMFQDYGEFPFDFGKGIYIPKTQEVMDLTEACDRGIEGIEKVFTEAKVGRLIGDMDKDRRISIKDATYIQKMIAGFEGFTESEIYAAEFDETLPISISDFNRDRVRNIKDATAIQKYLAGITEE